MYPVWVTGLLLGAVFVWLGILSFLIWRTKNFFEDLFPKSGGRDIRKKFEELLSEVENFDKQLTNVGKDLDSVRLEGFEHVQQVGLLRYNPYDDTGGDQSFSVALLNKKGNGVVLTSLHARGGTRVFAKPVKEGKGVNYRLSKEEEVAVRTALN